MEFARRARTECTRIGLQIVREPPERDQDNRERFGNTALSDFHEAGLAVDLTEAAVVADEDRVEAYAWPGNVAELKHVLEQAFVEAQGTVIPRERLEHALRVQHGETPPMGRAS
jgi:transcriptional regulator of acetoin/glycerol metabolism